MTDPSLHEPHDQGMVSAKDIGKILTIGPASASMKGNPGNCKDEMDCRMNSGRIESNIIDDSS